MFARSFVSFCLLSLLLGGGSYGATIYVPDDYPAIQEAIDAAVPGDTIIVRPGTYFENLDFHGKDIAVVSEQGAGSTTIDAGKAGQPVKFYGGEGRAAKLEGFSIRNGSLPIECHNASSPTIVNNVIEDNEGDKGGGINCFNYSNPLISKNRIRNNLAGGSGGGIYCEGSNPEITNNIIENNQSLHTGGGITCSGAHPFIDSNLIIGNTSVNEAGGIFFAKSSSITTNNIIAYNISGGLGGGIHCSQSSPELVNNTIYGNQAARGGGIYWQHDTTSTVTNCILWNNTAPTDPEIALYSAPALFEYCDIAGGWPGVGNISSDPALEDPIANDFHLTYTSPCIDSGTNDALHLPLYDFEGDLRIVNDVVDMGADEFYEVIAVPADYATIQEAIDAANERDFVVVSPGIYTENIDFRGKAITVRSTDIDDSTIVTTTIIDGGAAGTVVTFNTSEDPHTVLAGFTISNGLAAQGGGIRCTASSPTITNCIIRNNRADISGGGVILEQGSSAISRANVFKSNVALDAGGALTIDASTPVMEECTFNGNNAGRAGGAIYCTASTVTFGDNTFENNTAGATGGALHVGSNTSAVLTGNHIIANDAGQDGGGIALASCQAPALYNNIFAANRATVSGGGIHCLQSAPILTNNTFVDNIADSLGGGLCCDQGSQVTVVNTILWGDAAPAGPAIALSGAAPYATLSIACSDVAGGQGAVSVAPGCTLDWQTGNIDADPLFVEPQAHDYHLTYHSPCRCAGDNFAPHLPEFDFEGDARIAGGGYSKVDMGADEFYLHLYATGIVKPGKAITIKVISIPYTPEVTLFLGSGVQSEPQSTPYGDLFLIYPPSAQLPLGDVPANGVITYHGVIPWSWVAGETYPLQALAGSLGNGAILTNLLVLTVE